MKFIKEILVKDGKNIRKKIKEGLKRIFSVIEGSTC